MNHAHAVFSRNIPETPQCVRLDFGRAEIGPPPALRGGGVCVCEWGLDFREYLPKTSILGDFSNFMGIGRHELELTHCPPNQPTAGLNCVVKNVGFRISASDVRETLISNVRFFDLNI